GIALLQSHLASRGRILITIPTGEGADRVEIPAEVKNWKAVEDVVEVGCRFESAPAAEVVPPAGSPAGRLAALVARLAVVHAKQVERRTAQRVPYHEVIGASVRRSGEPIRGYARDLSRWGIAFVTTVALPAEEVHISLPQGEGAAPLVLAAR